jgi:hypothetical protein
VLELGHTHVEPVRIIRPLPALEVLVELAARRAALGVDVASTKFLAGREIEDPGREEEMLGRMAGRLNEAEIWMWPTIANAIFTHPLLAEGLNTLFDMFDAKASVMVEGGKSGAVKVLTSEWRPIDTGPRAMPEEVNAYGAVARKPADRTPAAGGYGR